MKRTVMQFFVSLAASTAMGAAFAGGTHAGGHDGHDQAVGMAGNAKNVTRTVNIDMADNMRFSPGSIMVKQGETLRFMVTNSGKLKHELVLGSEKELKAHYDAMKKNPEMEHDDPNQITLAPGGKGEILWQFTKAGKVDFACLQPGHYEAGMKGKIMVSAMKGKDARKSSSQAATETALVASASTSPASSAPGAMSDGEVRKIDPGTGKITIKHGPLDNLGMPAMTMVFRVKDPAWLSQVKAGDKIDFVAEKVNGAFTVTQLEPAK